MKEDVNSGKVDFKKLSQTELSFIKFVEKQNLERATKLKAVRHRNLITAGVIGVGVLSIYAYSMLAVKQETFLDDFEVPKTTFVEKN